MILGIKRTAALLNVLCLTALFSASGETGAAALGGIVNLAWALGEKIPFPIRRFLSAGVLIVNTVLGGYGVLKGGPPVWAVTAAAFALLSWNAGLFRERWCDPPSSLQIRYLKRIGAMIGLGLGAGLSALAASMRSNLRLPPLSPSATAAQFRR